MSGMRARTIILIGIAAVGIVLFSFANFRAGSRGGDGLDSSGPPAPGWGSERNLVQLPKPTGAEAFAGLPKPTGAPPLGNADPPEPSNADPGRATVAVEDPYNG